MSETWLRDRVAFAIFVKQPMRYAGPAGVDTALSVEEVLFCDICGRVQYVDILTSADTSSLDAKPMLFLRIFLLLLPSLFVFRL